MQLRTAADARATHGHARVIRVTTPLARNLLGSNGSAELHLKNRIQARRCDGSTFARDPREPACFSHPRYMITQVTVGADHQPGQGSRSCMPSTERFRFLLYCRLVAAGCTEAVSLHPSAVGILAIP